MKSNNIKIRTLSIILLLAFMGTYSYAQETQGTAGTAQSKEKEKNAVKEEKTNQKKFSNLKKQDANGDAEETPVKEKPNKPKGNEDQSVTTDNQENNGKPDKPVATDDQNGKGKPGKGKDLPKQPRDVQNPPKPDQGDRAQGKPEKPGGHPQKPAGPKERGDEGEFHGPDRHGDSLDMKNIKDNRGSVNLKNKDGLEGKELGKARAEEARMHKEGVKKDLENSVSTGETKVNDAREKIKNAREILEKQKVGKKIKLAEYQARKEKIDIAEKSVDALESKIQNAKKIAAE
jgi:hypothetical protein